MRQLVKPYLKQEARAGDCLFFTFHAFGGKNGQGNQFARQAWNNQRGRHVGKMPPKGLSVPVWFDHFGTYGNPPTYKNWGHAAVSLPDGRVLSSPATAGAFGQTVFASIDALCAALNCTYLGWSEWMDGTQIVGPDVQPAEKPGVTYRTSSKRIRKTGAIVRAQPTTASKQVKRLKPKQLVTVSGWANGDRSGGSRVWLRTSGGWVHSSRFRIFNKRTLRGLKEYR